MIPRRLHHIWLGGPLPAKAERTIDSWRRHHPRWESRLWTDDNLPDMPHLEPYFRAATTAAGKADMLRVELIHSLGGVYVDADIECLRPIDPLLAGCACFAACEYDPTTYGLTGPSGITNAIFGAAPAHPAVRAVIGGVPDTFIADNPLAAGPKLFRAVMHRRPDVRIFEKDIFCPLLPHEVRPSGPQQADFPNSYAVHWFNLSWKEAVDPGSVASGQTVSYSSNAIGRFGD